MSNYKQQEFDFINRTKEIVKQYDSLVVKNREMRKEEKYDVTLFINCLVGLLILPEQHWFKNLPNTIISEAEWGISESQVIFIKEAKKTVKDVARHLRNSVSHYNFTFSNCSDEIERINLKDFIDKKKKHKTFEADLGIKDLRDFAEKLTEYFLKTMREEK